MITNSIIKKYRIFLFLINLFFFQLHAAADDNNLQIITLNDQKYISINELTKKIDVYNSYDIITGRGQLLYKGSIAVYQTGISAMLINGKIYRAEYPVIRSEGELLFPVFFFKRIISGFYTNFNVEETHNNVILSDKNINIPEPKPVAGEQLTFIIIDPGHGGKDPGAIGKGGVQEKWITLNISKLIEEYLNSKLKNITIKITRKTDKFIELEERTKTANNMIKQNKNGLFVSIHVNASILNTISGFETYFLSQNPSNEEARTTATLENDVIVIYEDNKKKNINNDVLHIEAIMLNTQIQKESLMLANIIQKKMNGNINEFSTRGVKKADFFVLRGSLMPAVLVEVGYISNKKELKALIQSGYQKKIAKGIGDGIIEFIKEYNRIIK